MPAAATAATTATARRDGAPSADEPLAAPRPGRNLREREWWRSRRRRVDPATLATADAADVPIALSWAHRR